MRVEWQQVLIGDVEEWLGRLADVGGSCITANWERLGVHLNISLWNDPRTGRPWKSTRKATEWLDEILENQKGKSK